MDQLAFDSMYSASERSEVQGVGAGGDGTGWLDGQD